MEYNVKPKFSKPAFYFNGDEKQLPALLDWMNDKSRTFSNSERFYLRYARYQNDPLSKWNGTVYVDDYDQDDRAIIRLKIGEPRWIVHESEGAIYEGLSPDDFRSHYNVVVESRK